MNKQTPPLDIASIRQEFPILQQTINEHPLIYFDNAATTQKPRAVIDAISYYYAHDNSNVHRGIHNLSERATAQYEQARSTVQHFIHAKHPRECIFVRGTTEAINLVAHSFVTPRINAEEEILITEMEHHSNIVPWQIVCKKTGANLRVVPVNVLGEIELHELEKRLTKNTKFLAITHVSNTLGTINNIKQIIDMAHQHDVIVLVDGAQAAPHISINVDDLDCDFYAFSGHKMYGPTGIGVLYAKEELLEMMTPYQTGGEMISHVSFTNTDYNVIPHKFEAGTPHIAGAIGLEAAIQYVLQLDLDAIADYEQQLLHYATEAVHQVKGLALIGTATEKVCILNFILGKVHAHDVGSILNSLGIAVRSGHHCTMPLLERFDVAATSRASFSFYNTREEVDQFVKALSEVKQVFGS